MRLKPIKTRKIYEEIVAQIKDLIKQGNLKSGDRLPSERELCDSLQVSRTTVREALSALEAMGLLEIRPGEGTFIRQTQDADIIEPLAMMFLVEQDIPRELVELRKIIEVGASSLAAQRRDDSDLASMKAALDQMEKDLEEGALGEEADFLFHLEVAKASKNTLLIRLLHTISDTLRHTIRANRSLLFTIEGMPRQLLADHYRIYEAIRDGNSSEAHREMFRHLDEVENLMFSRQ